MQSPNKQPPDVYDQLIINSAGANGLDLERALYLGAIAAVSVAGAFAYNAVATPAIAADVPPKLSEQDRQPSPGITTEHGLYLSSVSELPGFRMKVDQKERKILEDSTLTLLSRPKVAPGETQKSWGEVCTLNMIQIPGYKGTEQIASTAAHCLRGSGDTSGSNIDSSRPEAVDILPSLEDEYAVADPKEFPTLRRPIGYVRGISANQRGLDLALLRIEPDDTRQPGERSRLLSDVHKQEYRPAITPVVGQQVALTSVPYAAGNNIGSRNHIGSTVGRYLGDWYYATTNGAPRRVAIVGIKTPRPDNDRCNFGASGSSARLADKTTLSALSIRVNMGYRNGTAQAEDLYYYDSVTGEFKSRNPGRTTIEIQRQLGVDLSGFDTLCGYNLSSRENTGALMRGFTVGLPEREILPRPPVTEEKPISQK